MAAKHSRRVDASKREFEAQSASSHLSFPRSPYPHSILLVFKKYDYKKPDQTWGLLSAPEEGGRTVGSSLRSSNSIELPFPKQLQDSIGLRINGYERDPIQEQLASQLNNFTSSNKTVSDIPKILQGIGADIAGKLQGAGDGTAIKEIINNALGTNLADVATAAKYLLQSKLPAGIARNIDTVTGQTVNPRETLSFEGVNLRSHQFSWDLYPSNAEDTERIKKIINVLKYNSLPDTVDIAGIPNAFLSYPSVVETYLIGIRKDYYIKFKPSMVTQLNVDYGAGGTLAIMKGGVPAGVNISITMQELEIETKMDYASQAQIEAVYGRDAVNLANGTAPI